MVLASTAIGGARRQAALYHARERRRSLLSDAELFRNLELADGDAADLVPVFPDALAPITFAGMAEFNGGGAEDEIVLSTGPVELLTRSSGLRLTADGEAFDISLSPGQRFRWNLAVRPGDGQVRFWVDSERRVAAGLATAPFSWHGAGTLTYDSRARLTARSPLSAYYQQRPRHFGDASIAIPPGPDGDSILFRAAIATFLTGSFPFQDNPQ